MLYDPKWEQQAKADPLKLETLISWLEKQPAEKYYDDMDCEGGCLLGQYMKAMGVEWRVPGPEIPYLPFHNAFFASVACGSGTGLTFGAALERARALQKQ